METRTGRRERRDAPLSSPPVRGGGARRRTPRARPAASPTPLAFVEPPRDEYRESERRGLLVATLARERYGAILELGCGDGRLGAMLRERCARYTGLDSDLAALAEARARLGDDCILRLATPLSLPSGDHELLVLTEILHRFDERSLARLVGALEGSRAPSEIVVVGPCGEGAAEPDGDAALRALVGALADAFEHRERALRRRYRIDALLRRG